jgi:hypothetical protein
MNDELQRAVGRIEGKLNAVHADVATIKGQVDQLRIVRFKQAGAFVVISAFTATIVSVVCAVVAGIAGN